MFNDSTAQEVNWHRHMTRLTFLAIDYHNEFESGTAGAIR